MIEVGKWIEPVEAEQREVQRPAYHLAGEFEVVGEVRTATLRATAHGLYEAFLNGSRIGDVELLPGCTAYRKRLQVQSFDVTSLVRPGANALGFLLSDGWWRGQGGGATRLTNAYGDTAAVLAEVRIELASGEVVAVGTDGSWRCTPSHILAADLIAGEVHDHRRRIDDWAHPGADRSGWDHVLVRDHPVDTLVPAEGPPTRRIEELAAVSVRELAPRRYLVDFGQNSNGWVRLTDLGPAGTTLTLVYGEQLDDSGDVTQDAIAAGEPRDQEPPPFQTDVVISAGDGSTFEPRHSTKGFRYVRIEGHPGPLAPESMISVVVHSDLKRTGGFTCSDERINRLHAAADWSFRGNACEIPTDCPHRERAGWTGDWQVFVATAAYLYDIYDFSSRWLRELAAEQWDDGTVLNIVPDQHDLTLDIYSRWRGAQGSSGWGDAACHVPWELYRAYGRADVLDAQFDSMRRWVDWAADRAAGGRHQSRVAARPQAAAHERYLWDTGFHFGEWTEPDAGGNVLQQILTMDHGPTATAFLYRSATEVARAADVLGNTATSERYAELADLVRDAWQREFIDDEGRIHPSRQANLVRALAFDLVPAELRQDAADQLVALIREADMHLGTGFLATPYLLPVLADNGYLDVAYTLLFQDSKPSWLAMIAQGATTIWESWDDTASLNHYSKGAVVSFLHGYVAGLQMVDPGYRRFRVGPRPGGGITNARTFHESPHGRIDVGWQIDADRGVLDVTVPPGTVAELMLPDGTVEQLAAGRHERVWVQLPGR